MKMHNFFSFFLLYHPARADAMEFSDLYYKGGQSFVTVKDKADQFKTLEDANNKDYSIGAQTPASVGLPSSSIE